MTCPVGPLIDAVALRMVGRASDSSDIQLLQEFRPQVAHKLGPIIGQQGFGGPEVPYHSVEEDLGDGGGGVILRRG